MAYGSLFRNNDNTVILGENVVPMFVRPGTEALGRTGNEYIPGQREGELPMWFLSPARDYFRCRVLGSFIGVNNYRFSLDHAWHFTEWPGNIGDSINIKYLVLGDKVAMPSGGYGLQLRNSNGQIFYHSDLLLYQPEEVIELKYGDVITIPNNKWICPLLWYENTATSLAANQLQIKRVGSTTSWEVRLWDEGANWVHPPPLGTPVGLILTVSG